MNYKQQNFFKSAIFFLLWNELTDDTKTIPAMNSTPLVLGRLMTCVINSSGFTRFFLEPDFDTFLTWFVDCTVTSLPTGEESPIVWMCVQ